LNPFLKNVFGIIGNEFLSLSRQYPYRLKRFLDRRLVYASGIQVFLKDAGKNSKLPDNRLANLAAGIELLGVGLNLHNFNTDDYFCIINGINPEAKPAHKNYTVDLLFGDAFYSRAVMHILNYNDSEVCNSILDSLKTVHASRLKLHREFVRTIKESREKIGGLVEKNICLLLDTNDLLKKTLYIGYDLFKKENLTASLSASGDTIDMEILEKFVENIIIIKTLSDLRRFLDSLSQEFYYLKDVAFLKSKIEGAKKNLEEIVLFPELPWLKENMKNLTALYSD
jgi:hypothetical protein